MKQACGLLQFFSETHKKILYRWITITGISAFIVMVACIGYSIFFMRTLIQLSTQDTLLKNALAQLESSLLIKKEKVEEKKLQQALIEKFQGYKNPAHAQAPDYLLTDIAQATPYNAYLVTVTKEDVKINIKGYVSNVQTVLFFLQNLLALPYINSGNIVHLKSKSHDDSVLEFFIQLDVRLRKESIYAKDKKIITS